MSYYWGFKPYVPVAKRRANALKEVTKLAKKGLVISPVKIEGRTIARTFWGKAWCTHLEAFCDFDNRLGRGRTYVRNGSVVHMEIKPGKVSAMVAGSEVYDVEIKIKSLTSDNWAAIKSSCSGQIATVIELLQGRISDGVMKIMTDPDRGLLPMLRQIEMSCSCPDGARMCKHVAAVLYAVGSRLDEQPQLLFTLRKVDHLELIDEAGTVTGPGSTTSSNAQTIASDSLEDVFGIELDTSTSGSTKESPKPITIKAATKTIKPQNRTKIGKLVPPTIGVAIAARANSPEVRPSRTKPRGRRSKKEISLP